MSDPVILIIGFVVVNVLSLLIAARVRKHLNAFFAMFTHVFVIFVSIYYIIDLILLHRPMLRDPYFYFWMAIILTQLFIIFYARITYRTQKRNLDEHGAS
jgi:hypothetical protein